MKVEVRDPIAAAAVTGGVSFDADHGWWTYTTDEKVGNELGQPFEDSRDALYIPTVQKDGQPVATLLVESIKKLAARMGFSILICAAGMWILRETGEPQVETIWVARAHAGTVLSIEQLRELAEWIKGETNQDCVAFEKSGDLHFTA